MNQFSTGDFGHALLNEIGTPNIVEIRAWWCCTFHGLRTFPDIHRSVFRAANSEIFYDLPIDGHINSPDFSAQAESRLAMDGTIRISIIKSSLDHALTLRNPSWAHDISVSLNGRSVDGRRISALKSGDVVIAKYNMSISESRAGDSQLLVQRTAFHYGPWLLGIPSEMNHDYFNELQSKNVLMTNSTHIKSERALSPFCAPVAVTTVSYIPAEYPEQPALAELHAVAEQTAIRPTRWEMAFIVKKDT